MIKPVLLKSVFILVHAGKSPILRQCGHFDTRVCYSKEPSDVDWFKIKCTLCESKRYET